MRKRMKSKNTTGIIWEGIQLAGAKLVREGWVGDGDEDKKRIEFRWNGLLI